MVHEGAAAAEAVSQASRRTTSRRELARHERFEEISPEVGRVDENALDDAFEQDPDAVLALLADAVSATDPALAVQARRLAARLVVDVVRRGPVAGRGIGRLVTTRFVGDGDLDLDGSLDGVLEARATASAVDPHDLRERRWTRPDLAVCLCLDRSGSMGGAPLAASALATAAVMLRAPGEVTVLAFSSEIVVVHSPETPRSVEEALLDVLALRGHGTTDLAGVLTTARHRLERSRAARRLTLVLSDARATVPGDVVAAARAVDELALLAPADDAAEAVELARQVGARVATHDPTTPSRLPEALAPLLERV